MRSQPGRPYHILGCTKGSVGSRWGEAILPLCSAPPLLEPCIPLWGAQYETDTDLLERVPRRDTTTMRGLEHRSCAERLRQLVWVSLEKGQFGGI